MIRGEWTIRSTTRQLLEKLPLPKVRASIPVAFAELARRKGLDRDTFLAVGGLQPDDLRDLDAEVLGLSVLQLIRHLEQRFPGESLGLQLAALDTTNVYGSLGYAVRTCSTLRDALTFVAQRLAFFSSHAEAHVEERGDRVHVVLHHHPLVARARHPIEAGMASFLSLLGLGGEPGLITGVRFRHAPTGPMDGYVAVFGVVPRFGEADNATELSPEALDRPLPRADSVFHDYLVGVLQRQVPFTRAPTPAIEAALRVCIERCDFRVEALADHAGMSVRTLHRRCDGWASSPRQLLDDVRHQQAVRLLGDPQLTMGDVAVLLGYADERSFGRAFKRWAHRTPAAHRRAIGVTATGYGR